MDLSKLFWDRQHGLLLVSASGELVFTAAGRAHYAPLLAKHGFSVAKIKRLEQFRDVMSVLDASVLEETAREFMKLLDDPNTTPEERAAIERVLST